jgi:hypothetical protein
MEVCNNFDNFEWGRFIAFDSGEEKVDLSAVQPVAPDIPSPEIVLLIYVLPKLPVCESISHMYSRRIERCRYHAQFYTAMQNEAHHCLWSST